MPEKMYHLFIIHYLGLNRDPVFSAFPYENIVFFQWVMYLIFFLSVRGLYLRTKMHNYQMSRWHTERVFIFMT